MESWNKCKMEIFGDYLKFYNNLDVSELVEAMEKMLKIEHKNGLDLFSYSISLPGIKQSYIF